MVTKRAQKLAIIALLVGFGSVVAFAGSLFYIYTQGISLQTHAQAVADHATQEKTYAQLAMLLESSAAERSELGTYILTESETIDFLAEIESLEVAGDTSITPDSLTVVDGKEYNTLHVELTIEGPETAVFAVVQILEQLPYVSYVNKMTISRDPTVPDTAIVKLQLAVTLAKS